MPPIANLHQIADAARVEYLEQAASSAATPRRPAMTGLIRIRNSSNAYAHKWGQRGTGSLAPSTRARADETGSELKDPRASADLNIVHGDVGRYPARNTDARATGVLPCHHTSTTTARADDVVRTSCPINSQSAKRSNTARLDGSTRRPGFTS